MGEADFCFLGGEVIMGFAGREDLSIFHDGSRRSIKNGEIPAAFPTARCLSAASVNPEESSLHFPLNPSQAPVCSQAADAAWS